LVKYGKDPQEASLSVKNMDWDTLGVYSDGFKVYDRVSKTTEYVLPENGVYGNYYENLYQVLRNKEEPLVHAKQALLVVKLIEQLMIQ